MSARIDALSKAEAKHHLALLHTVPALHRGPHRMFRDLADAEPIRDLMPRLVASIEQRDERTYFAPSAWHATAWLLHVAELAGQVANLDSATGMRTPYDPRYGAPVFRGQCDPNRKLVPTLFRSGRTIIDSMALTLLVEILQGLFDYEENRMNGPLVHIAALQHYGMPTPLLDFTADPRVAVFFACSKADATVTPEVVVYGIPLGVLSGLGGAVVLPPPWVKRLYAQRGLFLDYSTMEPDADIAPICFRVLFPPDPEYGSSHTMLRDEALLPSEPWYEAAIAWMHQALHSIPASTSMDALAK